MFLFKFMKSKMGFYIFEIENSMVLWDIRFLLILCFLVVLSFLEIFYFCIYFYIDWNIESFWFFWRLVLILKILCFC